MKRVITYGSFDLLHYGHIELLRRAKAMGDYLIVALSTDEFSASKGKRAYFSYEQRKAMLEAVRYVDMVVPERTWGQKSQDIDEYGIDVFVIDGSGDLLISSPEPVRIGLEDPRAPGRVIGTVALTGAAVCASSTRIDLHASHFTY